MSYSARLIDKRVPSMVHEWSPDIIQIFLAAMVEGDGCTHPTHGHRVIYTVSQELADSLQVLAIKAGISANIRIDDRTGLERVMPSGQRFRNLRPCYIVSLVTKRNMPLVNTGRRRPGRYWNAESRNDAFEDYEGTIHCVKVPNALLVLRRNGKPVVSGSL
jgi:intein/homing endonuclease